MNRFNLFLKVFLVCTLITCLFVSVGCEGTETREKADKSVEKFAGKDKIEMMDKMKADVQESMDKEAERLKEIEE